MTYIKTEMYNKIIEVLPILCVDVIIRNSQGHCLLIKRFNEPKKGLWWVIGGRVLKGESCNEAAIRKIREEVSLSVQVISPVGYFELINGMHPFGLELPYHAISIVFEALVNDNQQIKIDNQSTEWKYAKQLPTDFIIKPFNMCM